MTASTATINTITINGIDYIQASCATPVTMGDVRIIVADRGWVFVGQCADNEDGSVTIYDAKNIRVWGTTAGLGQLITGPTAKTKFDPYGTVRCTPIVQIAVLSGW